LSVAIGSLEKSGNIKNIYNTIPNLDLKTMESVDLFLVQNPQFIKVDLSETEEECLFLLIEGNKLFIGVQDRINEIVHEIKNVLTVVISSVMILLRIKNKGLLNEKEELLTRSLQDIEGSVHNVNSLLNSLKEINKDSGKEHKVRLKDFVDAATSELESVTQNSQINLSLNINVNEEKAFIKTKGIILNQILVNLFKNAVYSLSKADQIDPKLIVDIKEEDNMIKFKIQDNGEGVEPGKESLIFKSGFSTKGDEGSGVGLYLSRKGVERSGGLLKLVPTEGRGACFYFELPLS
jgi:signal transduction histidine kinase